MSADDVKAIEESLARFPADSVVGYDEARFALAECCTPERMRRLLDERARMVEALRGLAGYFRSGNAVPVEKATIRAESTEVKALFAALARAEGGE